MQEANTYQIPIQIVTGRVKLICRGSPIWSVLPCKSLATDRYSEELGESMLQGHVVP